MRIRDIVCRLSTIVGDAHDIVGGRRYRVPAADVAGEAVISWASLRYYHADPRYRARGTISRPANDIAHTRDIVIAARYRTRVLISRGRAHDIVPPRYREPTHDIVGSHDIVPPPATTHIPAKCYGRRGARAPSAWGAHGGKALTPKDQKASEAAAVAVRAFTQFSNNTSSPTREDTTDLHIFSSLMLARVPVWPTRRSTPMQPKGYYSSCSCKGRKHALSSAGSVCATCFEEECDHSAG